MKLLIKLRACLRILKGKPLIYRVDFTKGDLPQFDLFPGHNDGLYVFESNHLIVSAPAGYPIVMKNNKNLIDTRRES